MNGMRSRGAVCPRFAPSLLALAACSGAAAPRQPAQQPAAVEAPAAPQRRAPMGAWAEIGALPEREAEASFRAALEALQVCVEGGTERLEFMGGSIELAVKVDAQRQAARVWAAQSTLGERATEKCMLDALRSVSWPAPQGGAFGIARSSFEFEPRKGAPRPAVWDAGRVAGVLDRVQGNLEECGGGAPLEGLLVTLYIGAEGKALAGGAASDVPIDEDAVDCAVDALLAARYPKPERAPTKVRFRL